MQNKPIVMDGLKCRKKNCNMSELLRLNAIKLRCYILECEYKLVFVFWVLLAIICKLEVVTALRKRCTVLLAAQRYI